MKQILTSLIILSIFAAGCMEKAETATQSGNFELHFLFEHDGCKMYRFQDGTRWVYWSTCEGKTEYEETHHTGKHSSHTEYEETITNTKTRQEQKLDSIIKAFNRENKRRDKEAAEAY